MKRKRNRINTSAALLLLFTLLLPAYSAFAAGEQAVEIPILQQTELWSAAGKLIGKLAPDQGNGTELQLKSGETITGVVVRYVPYEASEQEMQVKALVGKTKVLLSLAAVQTEAAEQAEEATASPDAAQAGETTPAQESTPTPTQKPTPTLPPPALPEEGWIDSNLVSAAIYANLEQETGARASAEAELTALRSVTPAPTLPMPTALPTPEQAGRTGIFSEGGAAAWVPLAALALGIVGAGKLAWIAFSAFSASNETKQQTDQIKKLAEGLASGVGIKSAIKVEQAAWPKEGRVVITSDALDQIAARPTPIIEKSRKEEEPPPPPPKLIPPGEEPELLALCNSLAGVASADKWHSIVKEAGWRAVLLQTNPTEKGTYIPDESGYSVVACLMRGADADTAFVLPSYQDPNASEDRWSEFFDVSTDMAVRNYRVDALPEMFIERGTFFLQKSKGKLTRRPLYY